MNRLSTVPLMVATLLLLWSPPSNGTTLVAQDIESLSVIADDILTGHVIDATSFLKGGRIYTLNRIQISETVKGDTRTGEIIEVVTAGGHSEFFSQKVFGAAELEVNREYLLFLEHRGSPELSHIVGMTQGALQISLNESTAIRSVTPLKSMPRLMTRDTSTGRLRVAAPWLTGPRPLEDILTEIRTILGGVK